VRGAGNGGSVTGFDGLPEMAHLLRVVVTKSLAQPIEEAAAAGDASAERGEVGERLLVHIILPSRNSGSPPSLAKAKGTSRENRAGARTTVTRLSLPP
jgi:hypothetical protein